MQGILHAQEALTSWYCPVGAEMLPMPRSVLCLRPMPGLVLGLPGYAQFSSVLVLICC